MCKKSWLRLVQKSTLFWTKQWLKQAYSTSFIFLFSQMTKILIDGNNIKRNMGMEFDIDTRISYEKFCENEHYQQVFNDTKEKYHFALIGQIIIGYLDLNPRISEHITKKLALLFDYDVNETFENWMSFLFDKIRIGEDDILSGRRFYDRILNKEIDVIKQYLTDNKVLFESYWNDSYGVCDPKMFNDNMLKRIRGINDKQKVEIKKKVKFFQELVTNKKAQYLTFIALVSKEPIYLVYHNEAIVVNAGKLGRYIESHSLVRDISRYVDNVKNEELRQRIDDLRESYAKGDTKTTYELVTEVLPCIYEEFRNANVLIIPKNGLPDAVQVDVAWWDWEKDKKIKQQLWVNTHYKLWKDGKTRIYRVKAKLLKWSEWSKKREF